MIVDEAVARIREESALEPLVGVVLGSGLGGLADELDARVGLAYQDIPGWPVSTAVGHAGTLALGTLGGVPIAVMRGRAHLYEGIAADRVAFGVRVLARLGIRSLVVTNAAGGINTGYRPGLLVLISDHVNLQGTSSLVGPNDDALGPRFVDMSDAYDAELRARAREAAERLGIELGEGVYAAWLGPQFETPAEIRCMRSVGGDLAGMSTVQEVIAARHMGIRVLGISVVTNMAAGVLPEKIDHEAVLEVGSSTAGSLTALLRELVLAAARTALERAREEINAGADPGAIVDAVLAEIGRTRQPSLRRVLNATGVLIHTNLGRAPLAEAALARVAEVGAGYSNLEYDLERGERGSRQDHLGALLQRLTGAEAALVVNNNAAAVLLALAALAEGREVIVSRGELIEIGDGFRIPDVLVRSGARLVEVGTTNRTRAADYERAIGPETAVLLRVHQSNFRVVGFTERPELSDLATVAQRSGLPLVDDLGSGALGRVGDEPTPAESLRAGADLVCFSGDKLLGGPQAGVVVGRADLVERLRRHPLQRALRADKLTLAALEGTLALALDPSTRDAVPVLRMLHEPVEAVRTRAERLAELVGGEVEETVARVGGGALPLAELPSFACAVEESLAEPLRLGDPPVVALVRDGRTLLDCRTLTDAEVDEVAAAVLAART